MTSSFVQLWDFIQNRMRMSHIYQPVMLKELLIRGGKASIREIAIGFLARDESQIEYYEVITKKMPGRVLSSHGIVERDGDSYRLAMAPSSLSKAEREKLITFCDEALNDYLEKRGAGIYDHRRAALGKIPGTVRYEVLSRAGRRCELCGISEDIRAIELDHIVPRKHGGTDDITNLQALCCLCNANKGDRDDTDFRAIREGMNASQAGCIFCKLPEKRLIASNSLAIAIRDKYPVTPLHTLLIPRRHADT